MVGAMGYRAEESRCGVDLDVVMVYEVRGRWGSRDGAQT